MTDDRKYMQIALDVCRDGVDSGQSPFGACIVRDDQVLAVAHNRVWLDTDPTAHAEMTAIRAACRQVSEVQLAGATIYTTTEPCPMCFTAIHWSRIARIVYGARVEDAHAFGFNELPITNATMKQAGGSDIAITPDFMRDEALALFERFQQRRGRVY